MTPPQQPVLWELLTEVKEAPSHANLNEVLEALDQTLVFLPLEERLRVGAEAIAQVAEVIELRASIMLKEWEDRNNGDGPTIASDVFAGLVRMSMSLDLDDLKAPAETQRFKHHPSPRPRHFPALEDSVVGEVDKATLLQVAEEVLTQEKLKDLAGNEDIGRWVAAIGEYLKTTDAPVSLIALQRGLKMPLVEVWLGLLLGGYVLKQEGEFYQSAGIRVELAVAPDANKGIEQSF